MLAPENTFNHPSVTELSQQSQCVLDRTMWGTLRHYKIVTDLEDRKCMKRVIFVREEKYMEDYTGLCFPDINYLETAFGCKMTPPTLDACQ